MIEFKKFSSLENTYRENLIERTINEGLSGGWWVVTEKVDGANFSFWCDGTTLRVASRTQWVDGTFFDCQEVIDRYAQGIMDWCKSENKSVAIYGELYGDNIQKRVKYGKKDFIAFDVVLNGVVANKKGACDIAKACGVPFVPLLHTGTFEECLHFRNTFQSKLTPYMYDGDNTAEGIVIEPLNPKWWKNGSRVYFKNKSTAFSEKKQRAPKEKAGLSEEGNAVLNSLLEYCTEQRVSNVISKVGNITSKDFGKILGMTIKDILEDFQKDTERDAQQVDEWSLISKALNKEVGVVVRNEFVKYLD